MVHLISVYIFSKINPKITFRPSIKGFLSSKGVRKHLMVHLISVYIFSKINSKITFRPSIKGFLSSKGVWKHLICSSHSRVYFLPFIDHLYFINLKIPKIFLDFDLLTILLVDSTLTQVQPSQTKTFGMCRSYLSRDA